MKYKKRALLEEVIKNIITSEEGKHAEISIEDNRQSASQNGNGLSLSSILLLSSKTNKCLVLNTKEP
ncbi:MAG: hypothetical protein ACTSWN_14385 [Promethearchaeota archaeon]